MSEPIAHASIPSPPVADLFHQIRDTVRKSYHADPTSPLDKSLFNGTLNLTAARVGDVRTISTVRKTLERAGALFPALPDISIKHLLDEPRTGTDSSKPAKCFLLHPDIKRSEPETLPECITTLLQSSTISLVDFPVQVSYSDWSYLAILSALLSDTDLAGEVPTGFSIVGHVAHLNLRDQFLPYKHAIATAVLDKNPSVRTVINKIDSVGADDEYRTFAYEILTGDPDLVVDVVEQACLFRFDYSKVYWNSRLSTEHTRLVSRLRPGEAVCDVMAGVGPFSIPAGRKGVFCRSNDLNPESFACLADGVGRNKVAKYVATTNSDGRQFIRTAVADLMAHPRSVDVFDKIKYEPDPVTGVKKPTKPQLLHTVTEPRHFSHFVMNLPATAIEFLPQYIGLYVPSDDRPLSLSKEQLQSLPMPLVHVYTFGPKAGDNLPAALGLCERASELLGSKITLKRMALSSDPLGSTSWDELAEGEAEVQDVRDVAPKKRMFCLSLRLPREVAFRDAR